MELAYKEEKYNPRDVHLYHGKTFVTESGSQYRISEDGRLYGRKSTDGAKVLMIASVEWLGKVHALNGIGEGSIPLLEEAILEYGIKPEPELPLVLSLSLEPPHEKKEDGMVTSTLEKII